MSSFKALLPMAGLATCIACNSESPKQMPGGFGAFDPSVTPPSYDQTVSYGPHFQGGLAGPAYLRYFSVSRDEFVVHLSAGGKAANGNTLGVTFGWSSGQTPPGPVDLATYSFTNEAGQIDNAGFRVQVGGREFQATAGTVTATLDSSSVALDFSGLQFAEAGTEDYKVGGHLSGTLAKECYTRQSPQPPPGTTVVGLPEGSGVYAHDENSPGCQAIMGR